MKLNIEIECTPEEARSFLGLPDLAPVHEAAVEKMMSLTKDGVAAKDMEAMVRAWMPGMGENWQALQKAFWSAAASGPTGSRSPNEKK
ncbi:MAG: DUF6489 family protein [Pseudomonadota bacterium]